MNMDTHKLIKDQLTFKSIKASEKKKKLMLIYLNLVFYKFQNHYTN